MSNNTTANNVLELRSVSKNFGDRAVLHDLSLSIPHASILFLLGPSGCGKSTLLRIISGLEAPDAGEILLGDLQINDIPPSHRGIGMVFQNYALWPHLTVRQHLEFALQQRKPSGSDTEKIITNTLALVRLNEYEFALPAQLSGGQQQRLALARSICLSPRVLLLDEPFSNLDLKLRREVMRSLREIQNRLQMTLVIVAHDIEAVIRDDDLIAVMSNGRVAQMGMFKEVRSRPADPAIAEMLSMGST